MSTQDSQSDLWLLPACIHPFLVFCYLKLNISERWLSFTYRVHWRRLHCTSRQAQQGNRQIMTDKCAIDHWHLCPALPYSFWRVLPSFYKAIYKDHAFWVSRQATSNTQFPWERGFQEIKWSVLKRSGGFLEIQAVIVGDWHRALQPEHKNVCVSVLQCFWAVMYFSAPLWYLNISLVAV